MAYRPRNLSPEEMRTAIPKIAARLDELRNLDLGQISETGDPRIQGLKARIMSTLSQIYGPDTLEFHRLKPAGDLYLSILPMVIGRSAGPTPQQVRAGLERGRTRAIALLDAEIVSFREHIQSLGLPEASEPTSRSEPTTSQPANNDIFIVHGHDEPAKIEVTHFIERAGLKAVVLHEQPNAGQTIIEKFERHGTAAGFALVILTPDDVGGPDPDHLYPRARQNVIGEMFWFAAKLGRKNVCALRKGKIEMPSDFDPVVYIEMDAPGAWKQKVLQELEAAGYQVDWRKAFA